MHYRPFIPSFLKLLSDMDIVPITITKSRYDKHTDRVRKNCYLPHQGRKEMERRVRQIAGKSVSTPNS